MQFPTEAVLALEKILRAEAEVQDCARNGDRNSKKEEQLAEAVKAAVSEFRGLAARLWPEYGPARKPPDSQSRNRHTALGSYPL